MHLIPHISFQKILLRLLRLLLRIFQTPTNYLQLNIEGIVTVERKVTVLSLGLRLAFKMFLISDINEIVNTQHFVSVLNNNVVLCNVVLLYSLADH